jgi:hypothetical protein
MEWNGIEEYEQIIYRSHLLLLVLSLSLSLSHTKSVISTIAIFAISCGLSNWP